MSSVLNFPGPAAVFPDEPLDDPGVQPGDPGAEPPPANLEPVPVPAEDPIVSMIDRITKQAHAAIDRQERLAGAFFEQLSAGAFTCRMLRSSIGRLQPDDMGRSNLLMRELYREASGLAELLAPMCTEQKPATH